MPTTTARTPDQGLRRSSDSRSTRPLIRGPRGSVTGGSEASAGSGFVGWSRSGHPLGVEHPEPGRDADAGDDPEPDHDGDLGPALELEVVLEGRHPEDPL